MVGNKILWVRWRKYIALSVFGTMEADATRKSDTFISTQLLYNNIDYIISPHPVNTKLRSYSNNKTTHPTKIRNTISKIPSQSYSRPPADPKGSHRIRGSSGAGIRREDRELGPSLRQPHWTIRMASDHSSCEHMADSIQTCPATNYTHKFRPEILSSMELFS